MVRFIPGVPGAGRPALARALVLYVGRWRLLQFLLVALAGAVLTVVVPDRFPALTTALVVAAVGLGIAANLASEAALGLGHAGIWSFRYSLQNCLTIAGACLLGALAGSQGAVAAIVIAATGAACWSAFRIIRPLVESPPGALIPPGAFRFGLLQSMSGVLTLAVNRGAVVVTAVLTGSSVQAGYAALALGGVLAARGTLSQGFTAQLPGLVEKDASGRADEAVTSAARLAAVGLAVLAPLALVGVLALDPVLSLATGKSFLGARDALVPALGVLPLVPLVGLANQVAVLRLRPEVRLQATALGGLAFGAVSVLAVPAWGAAGATTALLAATLATILYSARAFPDLLTARRVGLAAAGSALVISLGVAGL
jgi:O-antigen/teichoic acid export membrane protein